MKIISTSPCRLSLFGGGTDIEPYSSIYGGICINLAINLRQHFILSDDGKDNVYPVGANPHFYETFLKEFYWKPASIVSTFDSFIESGIGASASAAVALVSGLAKASSQPLTRQEIAEKAWDIEVNKLGIFGGKQDQYAASFGGGSLLIFEDRVYRYSLNLQRILPYLVLFHTGKNRKSADIQEGFKELSPEQILALDKIKDIAYEAIDPVRFGDWKKVGELLDQTWEFKKKSNTGVTNARIDELYALSKNCGALGGKIMGAGGGGFMLFVCPPEIQEELIKALEENGCKWTDFDIDNNGVETRIL